ncbi:MAG TPA: TetR/AcrR family transcriptional regulator [Puia sp.]|jgi:AcrR family transcriptional regulator|nr:TetR/AcrR family transcriptional regulator [Puia sp.]
MGIAERKEKQKLEIRKQILEASMKLFVEEGFSNVSIRRIADIIEYSPTTIYLYFKDKDEIFYNLHEMGFQKLQEMNKSLDDIHNPLLRLHKMGENYIQFGMENPEFYDLMFIQREPMEKLTEMGCEWQNGEAALTRLRDTLVECMEKGYIAKTDPTVLSLSIWSTVHGLVSLATRQRLEKLVPEKENVMPMLRQSLTWLVNTLDISGKG